jgi:catechol 2,3-dioxygenase-like lactoylglutathione lyase family enzyme
VNFGIIGRRTVGHCFDCEANQVDPRRGSGFDSLEDAGRTGAAIGRNAMDSPSSPHGPAPGAAVPASTFARGIHHLALNTDDMKATVDFVVGVLGMPLIHALKVPPGLGTGPKNRGNPPFEEIRHYFFAMGGDSTLAYFEIPRGARPRAERDAIGGMQHVAFSVSTAKFAAIQERLTARGIAFDGPIPVMPGMASIYFYDPVNGTRLEACCQPGQGEAQDVMRGCAQSKAEALAELRTLDADPGWLARVTAAIAD